MHAIYSLRRDCIPWQRVGCSDLLRLNAPDPDTQAQPSGGVPSDAGGVADAEHGGGGDGVDVGVGFPYRAGAHPGAARAAVQLRRLHRHAAFAVFLCRIHVLIAPVWTRMQLSRPLPCKTWQALSLAM